MLKQELIKAFYTTQSFKWDSSSPFKLASGVSSPYYIDCRRLLAYPNARWLVAQLAYEKLKGLEFQSIGGLEIGAIPLATAISDYAYSVFKQSWHTFVVRKQQKEHGLEKLIEGFAKPGDRALIVDDVLTTGGSLLKASRVTREAGLIVSHAFVIVDRGEQEGATALRKHGLDLISLLMLDDLQRLAKQS